MNLRLVGIDVMTPNLLTDPPTEYTVIEINAAPGLDNYASRGPAQQERVRRLYRCVLETMIRDDAGR
jgi:D-alanine-D-alanine ligase-like ATP-grasp enzyme